MKTFKAPLLSIIGLLVIGGILDFGVNPYVQLMVLYAITNSIMAMSLNLVNGYTGQFSLGHAGFMAIGAYVSAFFSTHFPFFAGPGIILTTLGGGLLAAFAGWLVGLPSLRLKGDYLAIVTLGFGEIIRVALLNIDSLGGPRGISGIPSFPNFFISYSYACVWAVICFFVIWRLVKSSHGRGFLSVREDEIAAQAMGINTTTMKVRAFVLSSFFAGIAGAIFSHVTNYISPSTFTFLLSVNAIIMVVLGGMGSMTGSIAAAIFITAMPELLRPLQDITGIDLRMVIYSLLLILAMILRPKGLFGEYEITDIWRKYVRKSA
ncbi:MAG TPA: branched-chain amino acid ABC transporter permease [Pseudobdellovibrionaceae bacterium]|jgi:branched-chain amino acid transport system permease protein